MTGAPKIGFSSYSAPDKGVLIVFAGLGSEIRAGNHASFSHRLATLWLAPPPPMASRAKAEPRST